jgi:hypothetical protein
VFISFIGLEEVFRKDELYSKTFGLEESAKLLFIGLPLRCDGLRYEPFFNVDPPALDENRESLISLGLE